MSDVNTALAEALCGSCPGETLPILRCNRSEGHEGACEYVGRESVAHISREALASVQARSPDVPSEGKVPE